MTPCQTQNPFFTTCILVGKLLGKFLTLKIYSEIFLDKVKNTKQEQTTKYHLNKCAPMFFQQRRVSRRVWKNLGPEIWMCNVDKISKEKQIFHNNLHKCKKFHGSSPVRWSNSNNARKGKKLVNPPLWQQNVIGV